MPVLGGQQQQPAKTSARMARAVTNAVNNGSNLVRLTVVNHGFKTGNQVIVQGVGGTVEANSLVPQPIIVINANTIDLTTPTFVNPYTSGGTVTRTARI